MNRAFITLGSNIDPERNLVAAVVRLRQLTRVLKVSSVWESDPVGFLDQPPFCNGAVLIETDLDARRLKDQVLRPIEDDLGRIRDPRNKNAPRTIDLDLALFNREVFVIDGSPIPDVEIAARPFLALPLAELDPDYLHPTEHRTLKQIAAAVREAGALRPRPDIVLRPLSPVNQS